MKIKHLSVSEIVIIHNEMIERTGGFTGMLNYSNLDFTVDQIEATKGMYKKATIMMYQIIYRHPFLDGNKRTGYECMRVFLIKNGKKLLVPKEEVKGFTLRVSTGKSGYDEILKWIEKYTE